MSSTKQADRKPLVIGVGEILWDMLPAGKQLGGAPANFAYHAHALGAEALVMSRVGDDALGREALSRLRAVGLPVGDITIDPVAPTGTVSVVLDPQGKPTFTIHENVAWDLMDASKEAIAKASQADAICFGTLGQRNPRARAAIRAMLHAAGRETLCIFDINLRQQFWSREVIVDSLELADVLKLNDEELPIVANLLGLLGDESAQMRQLGARFNLKSVALTKGANGSALLAREELVTFPGSKLQIVDTVGAGDSYTAALTLGLLRGDPPLTILQRAHTVADFVCTQPGAMPAMPATLVKEPNSLAAII